MKKRLSFLFPMACLMASAQSGVVTNAIGSSSAKANVIAPRMLASVNQFGVPFGGSLLYNYWFVPDPAPVKADVFIRPAGKTDLLPATVVSAVTGTVTFVVPAGVPYGTAEVLWRFDGQPFRWTNVAVAQSNFELAPGAVGLATPAKPGQAVTFGGSGLGYGSQVNATVGGAVAKVIYAGPGHSPGRDEIQVEIPASAPTGCYVPLTIANASDVVTSTVSVTADGSPCTHPLLLTAAELRNLDAGGSIPALRVAMLTPLSVASPTAVSRDESATVSLQTLTAADLANAFTPAVSSGCTATGANPAVVGEVRLGYFSGSLAPPPPLPVVGPLMTLRHGALTLTATSDQGYWQFTLPASANGALAALPANVLAPGQWTLLDEPLRFDFNLPAPLLSEGTSPLNLDRTADRTIKWNGAAYDSNARATVFLNGPGGGVTCSTPASAGSVTIPAALLSGFRAGSIGSILVQVSVVVPAGRSGALPALVTHTSTDSRPADFQ